jgi:stage II sporulation protein D
MLDHRPYTRRTMLIRLLSTSPLLAQRQFNPIEAAFRQRPGAAIVLRIATGRIVSSHGIDTAERMAARPGSTIKPFVLEALRSRNADSLRISCPVRLRIGTRRLDCTHAPLNEPVDAHRAITYSCNNWFAESSRRLSAQDLRQALLQFGFGSQGSVELAPDDDNKRMQALGEACIRVTPLEMARAFRKLALRGSLDRDLVAAATFGTAQMAAPLGAVVAAKTGTTSEGAWIAGWLPDYVVVVWLPVGSGGWDAAPVARQIFTSLMQEDPRGVKVQYGEAVLKLPFEEYVAGVVAGEAGAMPSSESLKAMAVAARTWAAAFRGRHRREGFDFCSTTHCQEYLPASLTQTSVSAVRDTAGEFLWWQGQPALTYYSRDCGGVTEAGEASYLRQQQDPWCRSKGHNEWRAQISRSALHADSVRILERTPSGRVGRIAVGRNILTGQEFRLWIGRQMGWNLIRSDTFEVSDEGDNFVFHGTGAGHGVGLCQIGAAHMGEQGRGYREILAFYYPGAVLSRSAQGLGWQTIGGERVRIMTTNPKLDSALVRTGDRLAAQVERRVGMPFTHMPVIRVYPSVATFRDGTAEPGWVAGSTQGRVIRLQPGVDEDVLRHELMHELIEQHAAPDLPMWFREDLVAYLMGNRGPVSRLVQERGERTVLGWVTSGLPRELNGPIAPRP